MSNLVIEVVEGQPLASGIRTVVGSIKVRDLIGRHKVATRDFQPQYGYQRGLSASRVNKLARDLDAELVDIPTAILLNIRNFDSGWMEMNGDGFASLRIPEDTELWIVDGQHRTGALEKLFGADPDRWGEFRIQFVLLLGSTSDQELRQFYVVNSNAKSVRTDLAYDLLKQQAQGDPAIMQSLIAQNEKWKVDAQALVEKLGLDSSMWKGLVRFPGEPGPGTTINSTSMVNSIKALLKDPFFGQLSTDQQTQVLNAYWSGIAHVLPEAFASPTDYAIQKGVGAAVLNGVFRQVLTVINSRHDSQLDPNAYSEVMEEPLLVLEGENGEGVPVSGAAFWLVGTAGAGGSFSSSAGRRVLTSRILHGMPSPEVLSL